MIKAVLRRPNGSPLYILGLSEENVKRLKEGFPIAFAGNTMGLPGDFVIMYGATEEIIETMIDSAAQQRG